MQLICFFFFFQNKPRKPRDVSNVLQNSPSCTEATPLNPYEAVPMKVMQLNPSTIAMETQVTAEPSGAVTTEIV